MSAACPSGFAAPARELGSDEEPSIAGALAVAPRFGIKAPVAKEILREVFTAVSAWRKTGRQLRLKMRVMTRHEGRAPDAVPGGILAVHGFSRLLLQTSKVRPVWDYLAPECFRSQTRRPDWRFGD